MTKCCIVKCGASKNKNRPRLTLHRFPKNNALRKKWLESIGEENINPRHKNWFVCSLHFEKRCFNETLDVIRLKENSVPTIFTVPGKETRNLQKNIVLRETDNIKRFNVPSSFSHCSRKVPVRHCAVVCVPKGTGDEKIVNI